MSTMKRTANETSQLAKVRKKRESLESKLKRAIEKERDIAIAPFLKNDKAFHNAEITHAKLRRELHIIRQNLQKKQLSIECQEKRLAETRAVRATFVEAEKKQQAELDRVIEKIEAIKNEYAKQINAE